MHEPLASGLFPHEARGFMDEALTPFGAGSISIRLYPHEEQPAPQIIREMRAQAALATEAGFHGVMTSEHHGGFAGYIPNPLQMAGWLLEAITKGWAAASPLLLTLRPPALVAEEVAWLAARYPGRVGVGVAAGALEDDFKIAGSSTTDLANRFAASLEYLSQLLAGGDGTPLEDDPAIKRCREHPVPVLSAAMGFTAVKRAARLGTGILLDSLSSPDRLAELVAAYRRAGGSRSCIVVRRAWLGDAPKGAFARQTEVYRGYAPPRAQARWEADQLLSATGPHELAEKLFDVLARTGADSLNIRIHVPGIAPREAREQIVGLGNEVLPRLRLLCRERSAC